MSVAGAALCHAAHCNTKAPADAPLAPKLPLGLAHPSGMWHRARQLGHVDDIPEGLVQALREGSCVAMVGAGLSYPAGLPGYEALLTSVSRASGVPIELPDNGSYDDLDEVQFRLADRVGKEEMSRILRSELYLAGAVPRAMRPVLEAFCRLPFAAVVSWNWDNVLDARYASAPNNAPGFREVLGSRARPGGYDSLCVPLLKMQGDLEDAATVVLTRDDYRHRARGAEAFQRALFVSHTVLHIGMSLRAGGVGDNKRPGARHYAILNDVTPARREELERWNIHAVSYDSAATKWNGNQIIMHELARRVYHVEG